MIYLKKYLYCNMCFAYGKESTSSLLDDSIQHNVNYINENKKFSFNLYPIIEGKNLIFNINKNEFTEEKNIINILNKFEKILNIKLNNNHLEKKGSLNFTIGNNFSFANHEVTLNKENNKLIGRKNNVPFFKKTYNLEDFIGAFVLTKEVLNLENISYKLIDEKNNLILIMFYRKTLEGKGNINNFTIFAISNGKLNHILICIDGEYKILKIENNIEKHTQHFSKII